MHTTYHLESADEINSDLLDSIKAIYKSKPITLIVADANFAMADEMKTILDERLEEDEHTYLSAETSIHQLRGKYGL